MKKPSVRKSNPSTKTNPNKKINNLESKINQLKDELNLLNKAVIGTNNVVYKFSTLYGGLFYSSNTGKILGYSNKFLKENPNLWNNSIHPDDKENVNHCLEKLKPNSIIEIEYRFIKKNNKVIWLRDRLKCINKTKKEIIIEGFAADVTKLKTAENDSQISNYYYETIFDQASDAIFIGSNDEKSRGTLVKVNKAASKLTGYAKKELVGKNYSFLFPNDELNNKPLRYDLVLAGKEVTSKRTLERKNKTQLIVQMTSKLLSDGRLISFVRDVSEAETNKKKIEESEVKYRSLIDEVIESSSVGIFILDADLKVVWVNQSVEDFFGIKKSAAIGTDKIKLIKENICRVIENPSEFAKKVIHSYKTKNYTEDFECRILPKGKRKERWLLHWSQPIKKGLYKGGRIEHYTDITSSKLATEAIKNSEAKFSKAFKSSALAMSISDIKSGKLIEVNNKFLELTRFSRDELIGNTTINLGIFDINERTALINTLNKLGRLDGIETELKSKDRKNIYCKYFGEIVNINGKEKLLSIIEDVTDQKTTEVDLQKANAELNAIYKLSPVMTCIIDKHRNILYANNAFTDFTGTSEEELRKGKACGVIGCINALEDPRGCGFGTDCANCKLKNAIETTYQTGSTIKNINYSPTIIKSGFRKIVHLLGSTSVINLNNKNNIILTLQDVSEQKETEENLTKYKNIVSSTIDSISLLSSNYEYLIVNEVYEKVSGKRKEEIIGKTVAEYLGRETFIKQVKPKFDRCLKGEIINYQDWFNYPVAGKRFIDVTYYPYKDSSQKIVGIIANSRDITERELSKIALEENESRLRQIADNVPGIVYQFKIDKDGNTSFPFMSKSAKKYYGYSSEEIMNDASLLINAVHPDDRELFLNALAYSQNNLTTYHIDIRLISKSGKVSWINAKSTPVKLDDGSILWTGIGIDTTKQKITEEKLKENEERLRLALTAAEQGLYDLNIKTGEAKVNDEYATMLGYTPKTFKETNQKWIERIHPDDREKTKQAYLDYISGKTKIYKIEFRQKTKDGSWKWILSLGEVVEYDKDGSPLRMLGTHTDITNIKNVENALKQSEQRFNLAINATDDGIFDWDLTDNSIYYSPNWKRMLGYEDHEIKNEFSEWERLTDSQDVEKAWVIMNEHLEKKRERYEVEIKMKHKNGEWIDVLARGEATRDQNDKPIRVVGTHLNITQRKVNERKLAESEKRFRNMADTAPVLIWMSNKEMLCTYFNKSWIDFTGVSFEKQLGNGWVELVHPDDRDFCIDTFRQSCEKKISFKMEYRLKYNNGSYRWIFDQGVPRFSDDGKYQGYIGSCIDIHETVESQDLLKLQGEILHNMAEGSSLVSVDTGKFIYTNPSFEKMFGYNKGELIGKHVSIINAPTIDDPKNIASKIINTLQKNNFWEGEVENIRKDGSIFWTTAKVSTFNHHTYGNVWVTAQADISAKKELEERITKEKQSLATLHDLYSKTHEMTDNELYQFVIDRAAELTESEIGFFHRIGEDQSTIMLTAWSQKTYEYCNAVYDEHYPIDKAGNWIEAVRQRKPIVYNNFALSPNQKGMPEGHAKVKRMMSVPVIHDNKVKYIFGVGNKSSDYTDNDILQIQLVSDELQKILTNRKAENELITSNQRLKEAEEIGNIGYFLINTDDSNVIWSDETYNILGRKKDLGLLSIEELYHYVVEEDAQLLQSELEKAVHEDYSFNFQYKVNVDSQIKYIQCVGKSYYSAEGKIAGVSGVLKDVTDYQTALEKLKENEEKFEKAFKTSPDALAITRVTDGMYIDVNDSFKRILGYEREEMVGKSSIELNVWKYEKDRDRLVKGLREKGFVENLDAEYLTKSGEVIYGLMSARLIKLGNEDVILSITRDITDRINMEKDLLRSEERYKAIVKAQPDIFFRLNKDLIFTDFYTNDTSNLLVQPEKILGAKVKDTMPDYLFEMTQEKITKTLSTGKVQTYEYMLEINGEERWFDARMVPSSDEEVFVIVRDMTENKKAEKAIAESELKYRKLISNISDVIVVIDKNSTINYKSSNIENYFGWKPEDLIGKDALITVHPKDRVFVNQELEKLLIIDNHKTTFEFDYLCKDGSYKPVELTAFSLINDPTINGIVANYKDISERKKAEHAFIQTQRLGAIGEMSSAIAHDFNNSLQSIYGNLELALLKIEEDHLSRKFLETIKTATADASARVKLLQRFAGKSKGKDQYKKVNIKNKVEDVILQSRPIWKDNPEKDGFKITISKDIDTELNTKGNEAELRSVLYNIIKNSVEAMPKGGEINISAVHEKDNIVITCKDTGIGMNEDAKSRIFQPFFTTKGFETGRGLGMSGAYSIIKEHGGIIYVHESIIGTGTTIKIELPIFADVLHQIEIKSDENTNMVGLNILWVDDDSLIRDIAEEMLEVLEHKGKVVQNGEIALELLKNESFDLVVTDIGMPGMNGWDLADKIREEFNDKIKIIALTGWGDQISDEKRKQHGVSELLSKPFKIEQLKGIINKVMQ